MSVDDYDREYHLTKDGWVAGSSYFYGVLQGKAVARPERAVETWKLHVTQQSSWSKEISSWTCTWYNQFVSSAIRQAMRDEAGTPSKGYPFDDKVDADKALANIAGH